MTWSSKSKNNVPAQNPIKAGKKLSLPAPVPSICSIAGIIRLQTDAATITPAAKPVSAFCTVLLSPFFINSTQAAPKDVPKKGIKIPFIASYNIIRLS